MSDAPQRRLRAFFLAAHPVRSVAEAVLFGMALMELMAASLSGRAAYAMSSVLFILTACGMWAVLRTRLPIGRWRRQVGIEALVAAGLGVAVTVGLRSLVSWRQAHLGFLFESVGGELVAVALFAATGVGYFFTRIGLRVLLFWNHLRRRRLLWSITNAHLLLVVALGLGLALVMAAFSPQIVPAATDGSIGWLPAYLVSVATTAVPVIAIFVLLGGTTLLVVLPPSALLSYFIARGTTRRLENLAKATSALRGGDYSARATVEGEDEVAQLQGDFNAMAEALQGAMADLQAERDRVADLLEARRALVANVSHELRTPVATVRAALESSAEHWDDTPPEQLRANVDMMRGEIIRLQGLIDDLFTLSRADAGGLALTVAPTDVAAVVRRMVDALAPLAWRSGRIELIAELPPGLPRASADEGRLEQVLANLLRNAIRHTPPGGIIVARASQISTGVRIDVCDTGEGIPPEDLPRIWERFYRGSNGNSRDGAGLGLALVKDLTEAMGGAVAVESAPGQGSCFTIMVPIPAG